MRRCRSVVQNARDAPRTEMHEGGVAAASGRWRRRKGGGGDYYDVVLIQVGK